MSILRRHWPLCIALTGALAFLSLIGVQILATTGGHLVYALDDPYIHLTLARNLARYGTWGINPHEFASADSSLVWPLMLAVFIWLFGNSDIYPLLLNIILALVLITVAYRLLDRHAVRGWLNLACLTIGFFAAPIPALVYSGMEHVLQILAVLLFADAVVDSIGNNAQARRSSWHIFFLAMLVTATRYEGMFIVSVACVLLFVRRRFWLGIGVALAASLPIALFGLISVLNGWYALPSGLILKGFTPTDAGTSDSLGYFVKVANRAWQAILASPHLFWLATTGLFMLLLAIVRAHTGSIYVRFGWLLYIPTLLLHVAFASIGWFFRYEAYLVFWGIVLLALSLNSIRPTVRNTSKALASCIVIIAGTLTTITFIFLAGRSLAAMRDTPLAAANIYEQQIQMSNWLKRYYAGQVVAINDIGAIGYRSGVTIVDLYGLASLDVIKLRQTRRYTPIEVEDLANSKNAAIAVIYDEWFTHGFLMNSLPTSWLRAGSWKIHNNVVAGSDTVSFYALRAEALPGLVANLRAYASQLPADVEQTGLYMNGN